MLYTHNADEMVILSSTIAQRREKIHRSRVLFTHCYSARRGAGRGLGLTGSARMQSFLTETPVDVKIGSEKIGKESRPMNHYMPVRLFTGEEAVARNADQVVWPGESCLLVTGKASAVKSGALRDVTEMLERKGIAFQVFDSVSQNPSLESCRQAGGMAAGFGAAFIIGIGGGSALDAAKAAAVFAANPQLDEEGFYGKAWDRDPLPIFLIGTTSGTGSEVTRVSVLTDSRGRKHSIHDDKLYACAAFGDPRYTMGLPYAVTLSTGIDVLSHCAESYFNRKADEISRAHAVRGIRLLNAPLTAAARGELLTLSQREELYNASILGGLAICGTGTCFPHNVGYYLTEQYGLPHGFASAVFLPDLLRLAEAKMPDYAAGFYRETGLSRDGILKLLEACLPENEVHMTREEIDAVLPRWENNNSVLNTCCTVSTDEIREILTDKFT